MPLCLRRIIAGLLLVCVLLLCGCGRWGDAAVAVETASTSTVRILRLQLSGALGKETLEQVDRFSRQVEELSQGHLLVRAVANPPDGQTLAEGVCDLALLRNAQMAQMLPGFSTFSLPFVFDDQQHMNAALNAPEMLRRLRKQLADAQIPIYPLAALSTGGAYLVSEVAEVGMPGDFKRLTIAMYAGNIERLACLEALGARVLPFPSGERLEGTRGRTLSYLPSDPKQPSEQVVVNAFEAELDAPPVLQGSEEPLYLLRTSHALQPLWLAANTQAWQGLSAWERAVLQEAAASLNAGMAERMRVAEEQFCKAVFDQGVVEVVLERQAFATALYGAQGEGTERFPRQDYFDSRLYQFIQAAY